MNVSWSQPCHECLAFRRRGTNIGTGTPNASVGDTSTGLSWCCTSIWVRRPFALSYQRVRVPATFTLVAVLMVLRVSEKLKKSGICHLIWRCVICWSKQSSILPRDTNMCHWAVTLIPTWTNMRKPLYLQWHGVRRKSHELFDGLSQLKSIPWAGALTSYRRLRRKTRRVKARHRLAVHLCKLTCASHVQGTGGGRWSRTENAIYRAIAAKRRPVEADGGQVEAVQDMQITIVRTRMVASGDAKLHNTIIE